MAVRPRESRHDCRGPDGAEFVCGVLGCDIRPFPNAHAERASLTVAAGALIAQNNAIKPLYEPISAASVSLSQSERRLTAAAKLVQWRT